eukprot:TRINITY_DN16426_c1_g4_i2.p1 TRINITY_DN16426_c1_g4~~TRINITY_DN16426_c1_g4_i2.p1  ORF type:complete len:213 (+),score=19.74 TRINITY_DN16426_c1_g4_i2:276-914(+)
MTQATQLVANIHEFVPIPAKAKEIYKVLGNYRFYHFGEQGMDDRGWGCAYRSLQTVCSWLHEQNFTKSDGVPSHKDIEQVLLKSVDGYKGIPQWIGSWELFMYLDVCFDISSKILNSNSSEELLLKYEQIKEHFQKGGSPIMSGAGNSARIIIGIGKDENEEQIMLVLDPHYIGINDPEQIISQGYCGWSKMADIGKDVVFSNLLLPQVYTK